MTLSSRQIGVLHDVTRSEAPVLQYKAPERAALVSCAHCMETVRADKRKYWDATEDGWVEHRHRPGLIAFQVDGDIMADGTDRPGKKRRVRL